MNARPESPGSVVAVTKTPVPAAISVKEAADNEARRIAALAASVVTGLYRIVKGCMLFDTRNEVTDRQAGTLVASVQAYCAALDTSSVEVTFTLGTVFVDSKLVRTTREGYELALQLARQMSARGINEISLQQTVTATDIEFFARTLQRAMRDTNTVGDLFLPRFGGLRASFRALEGGSEATHGESPAARAARVFSVAVMCATAFFDDVARGRYEPAPRLKRIATRLALEYEAAPGEFLMLALSLRDGSLGAAAVSSAVLAIAVADNIKLPPLEKSRTALICLMGPLARQMIGRDGDPLRRLSDAERTRLPGSAALATLAVGKLGDVGRDWAIRAFEANWTSWEKKIPLYRAQRPAGLQSVIASVASRLVDFMRVPLGEHPPLLADALDRLIETSSTARERSLATLLTATIGVFPVGTLVELSSGEIGLIATVPDELVRAWEPMVWVVIDADGNLVQPALAVQLGAEGEATMIVGRHRAAAAQAQAMRDYVAEVLASEEVNGALLIPMDEPVSSHAVASAMAHQPTQLAHAGVSQPATPAAQAPAAAFQATQMAWAPEPSVEAAPSPPPDPPSLPSSKPAPAPPPPAIPATRTASSAALPPMPKAPPAAIPATPAASAAAIIQATPVYPPVAAPPPPSTAMLDDDEEEREFIAFQKQLEAARVAQAAPAPSVADEEPNELSELQRATRALNERVAAARAREATLQAEAEARSHAHDALGDGAPPSVSPRVPLTSPDDPHSSAPPGSRSSVPASLRLGQPKLGRDEYRASVIPRDDGPPRPALNHVSTAPLALPKQKP